MKKRIIASFVGLLFSSALSLGASEEAKKPEAKKYKADIVLSESNTVVFRDIFTPGSATAATLKARELDAKLPPGEPIYLIINSPGGDIDAGIELIENLNSLNHEVKTLTQFSASMGFQTVQGIKGERLVLANGTLMSHRAKGGFEGEFPGQLDTRRNYYGKRVERLDRIAVERSKGKWTLESYRDLIRDEYWCDGQDCVASGFADRVVNATCDDSLAGTKEITVTMSFMGMMAEAKANVAKCPLITGPVTGGQDGAKLYVDGKEYSEKTFSDIKSETLRRYILNEFEKAAAELTQIAGGIYRNVEKY